VFIPMGWQTIAGGRAAAILPDSEHRRFRHSEGVPDSCTPFGVPARFRDLQPEVCDLRLRYCSPLGAGKSSRPCIRLHKLHNDFSTLNNCLATS